MSAPTATCNSPEWKSGSDPERAARLAAFFMHARGIRTIEADGYVLSALRSGLRQADGIHMTAEGHRRVAEQLAASIR